MDGEKKEDEGKEEEGAVVEEEPVALNKEDVSLIVSAPHCAAALPRLSCLHGTD